jgi:Spy/CpxP family protein refolding chaperone
MSRTTTTFAILLLVSALIAPPLIPAQTPKPAGAPADDAKPRGRLPTHFGKLGISDVQRDKIYIIQAEFDARIDELLAQLEELRARRDRTVENVLTDGQKHRLHELRSEARREREQRAREKAADNPAP